MRFLIVSLLLLVMSVVYSQSIQIMPGYLVHAYFSKSIQIPLIQQCGELYPIEISLKGFILSPDEKFILNVDDYKINAFLENINSEKLFIKFHSLYNNKGELVLFFNEKFSYVEAYGLKRTFSIEKRGRFNMIILNPQTRFNILFTGFPFNIKD